MSKSVIDGIKLMLNTAEHSDVHFLVGEGEAKELLSAHKLILKLASDVFEAMFRFDAKKEQGENAAANCPDVVEIPDVEPSAFKVMLSFIYTDDLSGLNGDNAMAVLYAAKKYNIPVLVNASLQIPFSELRNVFFAYAQARLFDLENYVSDCLYYIDKNADDLLKSEEFLQIDQKLLYEILERDQLQIREEISTWKACRENGIECSAENCRQMLGPALFKIRFPLFSQDDFSEKNVPFGILTTNEVIGIEQYHTNKNFCAISGGLLYPLQFPSHRRIWTFGTLLMDIVKLSEFAREKVGSSRYSEKVYINGLSWRIWAQIVTKTGNTDNNEKWLGIYLECDAPEEDLYWHCNELMDSEKGFYNKSEDKVKLVIDVIVKDEKTEKSILDQSKSNGKISIDIEKVSEFAREIIGSEHKSEIVHIKGLPWKICAQKKGKNGSTDNEKWLGFYLLCAGPKEDRTWECKCSATFRIVSQKNDMGDCWREFSEERTFNSKSNFTWGYDNFISFAELMDPSKGFYNKSEDKVILAIDVTVKEAKTEDKS
ncbi:hypothetical protein niasHT_025633 [Heterodera trifolii]|uniref:BTB domain-containing protein n=1 Tax=Heterodera trifolii TaxID=157864 RepID=A0ABD2KHQ7_9BILA